MSKTSPAWSLLKARESLTIRGSSPSCRVMAKIGVHLMESREQIIYVDWSCYFFLRFSSVQLLSCVRLFVTPWTAACQASLSITSSQSLFKLMSIESVMPFNHLILCHPFHFPLQSFPASGSFPVSRLFASGGQSIGASIHFIHVFCDLN